MQWPSLLAQASAGGGLMGLAVPMIGVLGIMYFVILRPQQQEAKKLQATISALKKGDDVVTTGGMLGKVFAVAEKTLTLEVASGVKVRVLKSAISARGAVTDDAAAPAIAASTVAASDAKKIDEAKKEEK